MVCKGICIRHKATKGSGGRYSAGQKKCQNCEIFIWWDGIYCPCCHYKLRLNSRGNKSKLKVIVKVEHRY